MMFYATAGLFVNDAPKRVEWLNMALTSAFQRSVAPDLMLTLEGCGVNARFIARFGHEVSGHVMCLVESIVLFTTA